MDLCIILVVQYQETFCFFSHISQPIHSKSLNKKAESDVNSEF